VHYEDKKTATGSGRDYALAAMHCGKTAREAVEIACLFETGCGNGVDELEV
jgi:ATP-dependent protease HslVU (ClpYQ) peptidase subunit